MYKESPEGDLSPSTEGTQPEQETAKAMGQESDKELDEKEPA